MPSAHNEIHGTIIAPAQLSFASPFCVVHGPAPHSHAAQYVPVDTIIVARSSIPLIVAVMEYLLKWRELPTMRSWAALIGVPAYCVGWGQGSRQVLRQG